jgi:hypothetical protein
MQVLYWSRKWGSPVEEPEAFGHVTQIGRLSPKAEVRAEIQKATQDSHGAVRWMLATVQVRERNETLMLRPDLIRAEHSVVQPPQRISKANCCIVAICRGNNVSLAVQGTQFEPSCPYTSSAE